MNVTTWRLIAYFTLVFFVLAIGVGVLVAYYMQSIQLGLLVAFLLSVVLWFPCLTLAGFAFLIWLAIDANWGELS